MKLASSFISSSAYSFEPASPSSSYSSSPRTTKEEEFELLRLERAEAVKTEGAEPSLMMQRRGQWEDGTMKKKMQLKR